jgi:hypothetical protein
MTDRDQIGISSAWENGHFLYEDNDPNLIPGANYKYAVAGVNYLGEGFNSNELSSLFGEILASNIRSNTTLSGIYISDGTIVSNNAVLTINPGAEITFRNGASLIVNGRLNVNGTPQNKAVFDFIKMDRSKRNGIKTFLGGAIQINNAVIKNAYTGII